MSPAVVAYNKAEAARAAGVSIATIERAIAAGRLIAHYPTSRPVILSDDLRAWVEAAPTEKAS